MAGLGLRRPAVATFLGSRFRKVWSFSALLVSSPGRTYAARALPLAGMLRARFVGSSCGFSKTACCAADSRMPGWRPAALQQEERRTLPETMTETYVLERRAWFQSLRDVFAEASAGFQLHGPCLGRGARNLYLRGVLDVSPDREDLLGVAADDARLPRFRG